MRSHQYSARTDYVRHAVRDGILLVLGLVLLADGFLDLAYPSSNPLGWMFVLNGVGQSSMTIIVTVLGIVLTAIGVFLFLRLGHAPNRDAGRERIID